MSKNQTPEQVAALADAMVAVMNDMAEGNAVCDLAKAMARIAVDPFLLEDYGDLPDLEWAKEVVAKCDAPYA